MARRPLVAADIRASAGIILTGTERKVSRLFAVTRRRSYSLRYRFLLYSQIDQSDSDLMLIEKFR